jgi:hypothetical protein
MISKKIGPMTFCVKIGSGTPAMPKSARSRLQLDRESLLRIPLARATEMGPATPSLKSTAAPVATTRRKRPETGHGPRLNV